MKILLQKWTEKQCWRPRKLSTPSQETRAPGFSSVCHSLPSRTLCQAHYLTGISQTNASWFLASDFLLLVPAQPFCSSLLCLSLVSCSLLLKCLYSIIWLKEVHLLYSVISKINKPTNSFFCIKYANVYGTLLM